MLKLSKEFDILRFSKVQMLAKSPNLFFVKVIRPRKDPCGMPEMSHLCKWCEKLQLTIVKAGTRLLAKILYASDCRSDEEWRSEEED